jgi:5-methylcytosine-specific restriction endonuclease McrA
LGNREEYKQKRWNLVHRIIDSKVERFCTECEKWLIEEENFYLMNKKKPEKGYAAECKKCAIIKQQERYSKKKDQASDYNKEYYDGHKGVFKTNKQRNRKKNPELYANLASVWRKNNPGKIAEYNMQRELHKKHEITEFEWEQCKRSFNYKCCYCGMTLEEHYNKFGQDFHKEHYYNDGENDLSNCIPACKSCNGSKWKYEAEEWYKDYEFFSQERLNKIYQWLNEDYKEFIQIVI